MTGAQVATCPNAPAGWPHGTYTLVRRVKISATEISTDPRSRRRRAVDKTQLALALSGAANHAWADSFIITIIPANIPANYGYPIGLQAWFQNRTAIQERFREAKHGGRINHLPSADSAVNALWTWAGLLAGPLSVMLQSLTSLDTQAHAPGQLRIATLRHQLLTIPGKVSSHAHEHVQHLQPRQRLLAKVLARLQAPPAPT